MKVVVLGLWHLGCVTAACCAKFADVVGLDYDLTVINGLRKGTPPIFEPGLSDLINDSLLSGRLSFESDPSIALKDADLLWVSYDTPVDDDDQPDVGPVLEGIERALPYLRGSVLISSQIPAGTCRLLEEKYPDRRFAYSPENLRLGHAIQLFLNQDRILLGIRKSDKRLVRFLNNFSEEVIQVSVESAEMTKHAINAFLALSIAFMNEISRLCECVGADAKEVERGLKSERRIGPKAYLSPGGPFSGGTLARDVVTLDHLSSRYGEKLFLIPAIKASNDQHRKWAIHKLREKLGSLTGKRVAILGLTYKPNTDTLRRSFSIELCRNLFSEWVDLIAFDPVVSDMPSDLIKVPITGSIYEAVKDSDAVVVATEWPQLLDIDWGKVVQSMKHPIIVDANGYLRSKISELPHVIYCSVGKP